MTPTIRDLHGLDDYRAVVELEQAIWGYTDWNDVRAFAIEFGRTVRVAA